MKMREKSTNFEKRREFKRFERLEKREKEKEKKAWTD